MAVNPDNFVFHSDFWYPTDYISGYKTLASGETLLTGGYEPGDFYAGYVELQGFGGTTYVYYRMIGDTFWTYTDGSDLYAHKFQSGTGKLHYRLYKRPKSFNFISRGKLEKVLFDFSDTATVPSFGVPIELDAPTDDLFYCRGIWRQGSGPWHGFDSVTPDGVAYWNNVKTSSSNKLQIFTQSIPAGTIEYRIIGIKLYD